MPKIAKDVKIDKLTLELPRELHEMFRTLASDLGVDGKDMAGHSEQERMLNCFAAMTKYFYEKESGKGSAQRDGGMFELEVESERAITDFCFLNTEQFMLHK